AVVLERRGMEGRDRTAARTPANRDRVATAGRTALWFALAAARAVAQQSELPEPDSAPVFAPSRWYSGLAVTGSFSLEYQLRHTSDATDQDAYGLLVADCGDAATQPVTAHVVARSAFDLDGNTNHQGNYVFDSLQDTYQSRLTAQLYELWVGGALAGPV